MRSAAFSKRKPVVAFARQKAAVRNFIAPIRGWIANESLAASQPGGAFIIENFFPTLKGARLRGGSRRHATVGADIVESLLTFRSGVLQKMFAASAGSIFDITSPADTTVPPTPSITGQTSDYYSSVQFATAGGEYMIAVNGTDKALTFDGTDWETLDDATAKIAFDAQTANYTAGLTLTGGTSGATAVIVSVIDNGTTGVLRVKTVVGTFVDNELLTDSATGSATSNIPAGIEIIPGVSGAVTSTFSFVWSFKNRLFYVKKGTKTAVYMPVDSIGGAADDFSLDGVFKRGGSLLFGATWSLDAGDGLDDKCVFISTMGEAAVYEGTNPGDANAWSLVGRYDIARPMGMNATMQAGGDLLVATVDGLLPISAAINKDPAALTLSAISRPIEPEWKKDVAARSSRPWEMVKWIEKNMAIVSVPATYTSAPVESRWGFGSWGRFIWGGGTGNVPSQDPYCYVVNLQSGAWARYTGWDVQCLAYHDGFAFFGTADGRIMQAEVGGTDDGAPYVCRYAGLFESLGGPTNKHLLQARATWTYGRDFIDKVSFATDYTVTWPSSPPSAPDNDDLDVWDSAIWDDAIWDSEAGTLTRVKWVSIGKNGFSVAPMVQVTCGGVALPDAELAAIDLTYESGGIVV